MKIIKTEIDDVLIIEPSIFKDERGYFFESWSEVKYKDFGIECTFIQDNESKSNFGVLRGLHFQIPPYTQSKLVRVVLGKVLDVAVDIRTDSKTFGKHISVELSADNKRQLFIPRGFAHGFVVLSEYAVFAYKCDNLYKPSHECGILFNDEYLNINWKINKDFLMISEKDKKNERFKNTKLFASKEYLQNK